MELTVTAIQFVLAPDEPDREKRVEVAEAFLAGLEEGQEVLLKAEPMNPVDVNAVAAFMDYRQIGYLTKESAVKVEPLLDDKGQCKAVVKGSDNHLALFITVPDVPEAKPSPILRERTLPQSPLGLSVRLGIASDESRELLIASNLAEMEVTKENMPEILHLAELYLPLMNLSICYEDSLWLTEIDRKLDDARLRWQELGVEVEDAAMLSRIYDNVHEAAGDLHTTATHVPERIFGNHLDRLRQNKAVTQPFFKKYCDTVLDGKDFCQADRNKMAAEQDRLLGWLKGMKWDELRDPDNLRMMGYRVNYLRLSRQELYDLYSVLLLLERLKAARQEGPNLVFWDRVAAARKTYITTKRLWFVPCKCLMWMEMVEEDDFRTAVSKVLEHFPDVKLDHKDLSRQNVDSFRKSLDKWSEDDAPVKGKTYQKYHDLAVFLMQE